MKKHVVRFLVVEEPIFCESIPQEYSESFSETSIPRKSTKSQRLIFCLFAGRLVKSRKVFLIGFLILNNESQKTPIKQVYPLPLTHVCLVLLGGNVKEPLRNSDAALSGGS